MKWWNAVLPVITLLLGYFGTFIVDSRRTAAERQAAEATRIAVRNDARSDARRAFELETLLALQDAMGAMVRAAGRAHHFDVMTAREVGSKRLVNSLLPEDVNAEIFAANREVSRLVGRVLDERIRDVVESLRGAVATQSAAIDISVAEGNAQMLVIADLVDEAQTLVSARIRGIYDGSVVC